MRQMEHKLIKKFLLKSWKKITILSFYCFAFYGWNGPLYSGDPPLAVPAMLKVRCLDQGTLIEGGRINTVDLLTQTSWDWLLLKLKTLFTFFTKQATSMRRSSVLSLLPFQVRLLWLDLFVEKRRKIKIKRSWPKTN